MQDHETVLTPIGQIEDICPNCGTRLTKRPSRKTKCTMCGKYIYVRTRPIDRRQVLLTEDEAELVQRQWDMVTGVSDALIYEQKLMDKTRMSLERELGRQPTEHELKTAVCELQQVEHAKQQDWGLYRNDRFQIAEFQRAAGKVITALSILLEVCYLDLNGPNNCGGFKQDPELLKEYPPFKPNPNGLAPGIVERIMKIIRALDVDEQRLKDQFTKQAEIVQRQLSTPLDPTKAWTQFVPSITRNLK